MKLSAVALDYDGTIATDGVFEPLVREAVASLRLQDTAVVLVTGRRLNDLQRCAGDLRCFNAVVAENGAVLFFPASGQQLLLGHRPPPDFLAALQQYHIEYTVGDSVVETSASEASRVLELIRQFELPLILTFNRSRLMVLPQAIAKSVGLRRALIILRISTHNTLGIGDAENDHDLLDTCELGLAVEWGSRSLQQAADHVIAGDGPRAVADYLRGLIGHVRLSVTHMGRRNLTLGAELDGTPVQLALRGRTILVTGEPGSGKSNIAGLLCEQLILQGYCLCILDPEGDYGALETLPGVVVLGGEAPPPSPRELVQTLRYPEASVVIDLSKLNHVEKHSYIHELLPMLVSLRRKTGLPHKIVLDEAHYYIPAPHGHQLIDAELAGYILVTYRVSMVDPAIRDAADTVLVVTRETDPHEQRVLQSLCGTTANQSLFSSLHLGEAALLPGVEESASRIRRFQIAPRMTVHVRHREKYLDMPVGEPQAFVFTHEGRPGSRVRSLKEFIALLSTISDDDMLGHLQRHDFSRWVEKVFRDCPLATHLAKIEGRAVTERPHDIAADLAQAIRARYDTAEKLSP